MTIYTYKQAAEVLRISVRTLQQVVADGEIEYAQIRRRILFTEKMLEEYLQRNTAKPVLSRNEMPRRQPGQDCQSNDWR